MYVAEGGDTVLARLEAAAAVLKNTTSNRPTSTSCCTAARRRSLSRRPAARATRGARSPARDDFSIPQRACSTTSTSSARPPSRIDQLACTSLFAPCARARSLETGEARRVLCVSSEFFPEVRGTRGDLQLHVRRGVRACSSTTKRAQSHSRVGASTKGYYWQGDAMRNEIVASYFPTAKHVIDETLDARAGARRRHLGDPPQHQHPQLGHPARPTEFRASGSGAATSRGGTHARRRQLHQPARRGETTEACVPEIGCSSSPTATARTGRRWRWRHDHVRRSIDSLTGATGLLGRDVLARLLAADARSRVLRARARRRALDASTARFPARVVSSRRRRSLRRRAGLDAWRAPRFAAT